MMAEMVPFRFEARDGLPLNGYYVLPKTGKAPWPMVQIIHGGPHGPRDYWGWNREALEEMISALSASEQAEKLNQLNVQ